MDHMDPGFQGQIFSQALNIQKPWYIANIEFRKEEKRLDIWVNFEHGVRFYVQTVVEKEAEKS